MNTLVEQFKMLLSMVDALLQSFSATNLDGTPNQAAQDNAIGTFVDAAVSTGLIAIPAGFNLAAVKPFVIQLGRIVTAYKAATARPTL